MKLIFSLLIVSATFLSCTPKNETVKTNQAIQWYSGSMEKALETAKKASKPLFVYWGAQWCPPCNVVKSTIFKDAGVIRSTEKFISVALDGDTESAQKWGEKLKAFGYPTLMVLNSEGKEVVRLSGSSTPQEFSEALDSAYNNLKPISELIDKVLAMPAEEVTAEQWRLIAGFSWGQASSSEDKKKDWAKIYMDLYKKIPEKFATEKQQYFIESFSARLDKLKENPLTDDEKNQAMKFFDEILASPELFKKHYKIFAFAAGDIVKAFFKEKSDQREQYVMKIRKAIEGVRDQLPLASYDRLITYYPLVDFAKLDSKDGQMPKSDVEVVKRDVVQAFSKIENSYQQVFVTNSSSYILQQAGLSELARSILKKDIEKSKTPYYSMAALASLEKKAGKTDEAILWMRKAYDTSKGHATRLQWGSNYLGYLMDLKPESEDQVLKELEKYFSAQLNKPDAFYGRNKYRMNRVKKSIKKWVKVEQRKDRIKPLQQKWLGKCDKKSTAKTEYFQSACKEFFTELI